MALSGCLDFAIDRVMKVRKFAVRIVVLQEVDNELSIAIRGLHMDLGYLVV
jgi:hypothetical protein